MNNKNIKAPYMANIYFIMEDLPKGSIAYHALRTFLQKVCPNSGLIGDAGHSRLIMQFYVAIKEWQGMSLSGLAFVAVNKLFERINKGYPDFDFFKHVNREAVVTILDPENSKIEGHNVDMADCLSGNEEPDENDVAIL
jgi:hypothetical protein